MYIDRKKLEQHIRTILNKKLTKDESNIAPKVDNAGYNKYGKFWMTAISVDIRGFKKICEAYDNAKNIKLIQAFSSSLIKIMKKNSNIRDCYVNGDEVIGVFAASKKTMINDNMKTAILANSFANYLFPKILKEKGYTPNFQAGIGVWTSQNNSLVMYGEKHSPNEAFSTVIGEVVNWASYLASVANKKTKHKILFDNKTKINLTIEKYKNSAHFWSNINKEKVFGFTYRYNDYVDE